MIITGGIDLSVGSVLALLGVLLSMLLTEWHWRQRWRCWRSLALTMLLGGLHGLSDHKGRACSRSSSRYAACCFIAGWRVSSPTTRPRASARRRALKPLRTWPRAAFFGIPMPFVLLDRHQRVMWVVLHRSVYGRYLFAVGRNEEAARYSGINSGRMIVSAYVLCGALAGIAGVLLRVLHELDLAVVARQFLTSSTASRRQSWAAAVCAAAKARSSAF